MFKGKVFSFDAETNGLWGCAYAIGAIVYQDSEEVTRFVGRCPFDGPIDDWTRDNVLPQLAAVPVTRQSYNELLANFAKFYLANKAEADIIVHMGYIVEAKVLRDMRQSGLIGDWDGPFPLYDVSGNLQQVGENPTSVDGYATKYNLEVRDFGGTHNPLYDSEVAAKVYMHLLKRI